MTQATTEAVECDGLTWFNNPKYPAWLQQWGANISMRFLLAGTLAGGIVLSLLNWLTAAILPPRYKHFKDPGAVVEVIRGNVVGNDIYTAPQGLFASVSLGAPPKSFGARIGGQFLVEFASPAVCHCFCWPCQCALLSGLRVSWG